MQQRVHIHPVEDARPSGTIGATGDEARIAQKARGPELLDANGCIRRLSRLVDGPAKRMIRVRTALGDGVLPVMGDPGDVSSIFFALVECGARVAPGGSMTVLTTLLPVRPAGGAERTGNGSVLISFHVAARGGERLSNLALQGYETLRVLADVRKTVRKHQGSFSMCLRAAQMTFNIYLPAVSHLRLV